MEEILSPTAKMKEDIEIKGDSSNVFVKEDEEIEAVVDLEAELIAALEDLDVERWKNKKNSKKIKELNLQKERDVEIIEEMSIKVAKTDKVIDSLRLEVKERDCYSKIGRRSFVAKK